MVIRLPVEIIPIVCTLTLSSSLSLPLPFFKLLINGFKRFNLLLSVFLELFGIHVPCISCYIIPYGISITSFVHLFF